MMHLNQGPPSKRLLGGPPDQPTGQNYASCGKKKGQNFVSDVLPPAVKNDQNFAYGGEKTVLLF